MLVFTLSHIFIYKQYMLAYFQTLDKWYYAVGILEYFTQYYIFEICPYQVALGLRF